ncbi:type II secretion system F family protein [Patescibacteria group bacterium]|nr:type II secretion system F family protein [Patescibacteria group bacterium]
MAQFHFRVRDYAGKVSSGTLEAPDVKGATQALQDEGYIVVSLEKVEKVNVFKKISDVFNRVSVKDLTILSEQMATMFDAGVPIVDTLHGLVKQTDNERLKEILQKVAQDVEGGAKLSYALGQYPKVFSQYYVGMVRAGEESGQVSQNLTFLARQLKKSYEIRSEVRGALMYPAFVVLGVIAVMLLAVFYVLPNLLSIVQDTKVKLPWTTELLIGFTNFITHYWYIVIAAIIIAGTLFHYYRKSETGKRNLDLLVIKLPLFGSVFQKFYLAQFANNLSSLISGNVSIVKAFQMVGDMVPNVVYRDIFLETAEKIKGGQKVATVMSKSEFIPPMVVNMLSVGEETGRIDQILQKLASFYQTEIDNQLKGIVSLIEPIMIVLLGVGVAIIVSAVILPMYNLASTL